MKYLFLLLALSIITLSCKKFPPFCGEPAHGDTCINENYFFGSATFNTWGGDLIIVGNTYTEEEGREVGKVNFLYKELATVLLRQKIFPETIPDTSSVYEPVNRLNECFRAIGVKVTGYTPVDSFYIAKAYEIQYWLAMHCTSGTIVTLPKNTFKN